uniref:Uncharacterized protein n=1 Tax=Gouania willdenowi TaxID=441366 RepID=A0A8C5DNM4_GOUWI
MAGETLPDHSPLVAVTFQRDAHRKEKYLEAEPKALGVSCVSLTSDLVPSQVVIAGSLAVAAQSLHLPTLRACLGMQIIACGASICNLVCTLVKMEDIYCWQHGDFNATLYEDLCHRAESHFYAGGLLMQLALLAMSVTLAVYCCKVVNCCGPALRW